MKTKKKILFLLSVIIITFLTISQVEKYEPSPSDMNAENKTKFIVPKADKFPIQEIKPLQANSYEIQILSKETDIGKDGDILLTITGSGFYLTSISPKVVFNKEFIINNTETNKMGTELYVIISKETVEKHIRKGNFEEAVVISGNKPSSKNSGKIAITPKDFMQFDKSKTVSLKYHKGFFLRE